MLKDKKSLQDIIPQEILKQFQQAKLNNTRLDLQYTHKGVEYKAHNVIQKGQEIIVIRAVDNFVSAYTYCL